MASSAAWSDWRYHCGPSSRTRSRKASGRVWRGVAEGGGPKGAPPVGRLEFGPRVLGGPARLAFHHEAADVVGLLVDLADLGGEPGHVGLRHDAVAGRLVELDGHAHREAVVALDGQAGDFSERPLDLAVADDGLFDVRVAEGELEFVPAAHTAKQRRS